MPAPGPMAVAIALWWITTTGTPTPATDVTTDKACTAQIEKCISLCVRHNPETVCRKFCRPEFYCS